MPRYMVKTLFGVCLRGCFLDEINVLITRLVKQIALPNVGGPDSIKGLNITKKD